MSRVWLWLYALIFCACSNLDDPRFSKNFYEEKMMQVTRKSEIVLKGKTQIVMFSTYLSELDREKYSDGEYFFIEIDFEDEKKGIKDVEFVLAGHTPAEIKYIKNPKKEGFYIHSPWNRGYLVRFDSIPQTEIATLNLIAKFEGREMRFDYSFKDESIL